MTRKEGHHKLQHWVCSHGAGGSASGPAVAEEEGQEGEAGEKGEGGGERGAEDRWRRRGKDETMKRNTGSSGRKRRTSKREKSNGKRRRRMRVRERTKREGE